MSNRLRFTPYAWAKLMFLRDIGPTEVGGFGVSDAADPWLVRDFCLVKQETTATFTAIDDDALSDYMEDKVAEGYAPWQVCWIWIHTHPAMSASPSGQDRETFNGALANQAWSVMFILSKTNDVYCEARVRSNGVTLSSKIPAGPDYTLDFPASDTQKWRQEYHECVTLPNKARDERARQAAALQQQARATTVSLHEPRLGDHLQPADLPAKVTQALGKLTIAELSEWRRWQRSGWLKPKDGLEDFILDIEGQRQYARDVRRDVLTGGAGFLDDEIDDENAADEAFPMLATDDDVAELTDEWVSRTWLPNDE